MSTSVCGAAQARPQRATAATASPDGTSAAALTKSFALRREQVCGVGRALVPQSSLANIRDRSARPVCATRRAPALVSYWPDLYYLGMLYHLAGKSESALTAVRRFLAENPTMTGETAQNARAVFVARAVEAGQLDEAARALTDYARNDPQNTPERYRLESMLAISLYRNKLYERAAPHAGEAYRAAKTISQNLYAKEPARRDATLLNSGVFLAEVYTLLKRRDEAITTLQELRRMGLRLSVGNALRTSDTARPTSWRIARRSAESRSRMPALNNDAPEINVADWGSSMKTFKLARSARARRAVRLWATWVRPCRFYDSHPSKDCTESY